MSKAKRHNKYVPSELKDTMEQARTSMATAVEKAEAARLAAKANESVAKRVTQRGRVKPGVVEDLIGEAILESAITEASVKLDCYLAVGAGDGQGLYNANARLQIAKELFEWVSSK